MLAMHRLNVIPATAAVIGALAIAAPVAGAASSDRPADSKAPGPNVCMQIAFEGPMSVLGPYGVLGDYGPLGDKAGQPNPAANCFSGSGFFGMPGNGYGMSANDYGMSGMTGGAW
jgi:hypothetical protein